MNELRGFFYFAFILYRFVTGRPGVGQQGMYITGMKSILKWFVMLLLRQYRWLLCEGQCFSSCLIQISCSTTSWSIKEKKSSTFIIMLCIIISKITIKSFDNTCFQVTLYNVCNQTTKKLNIQTQITLYVYIITSLNRNLGTLMSS